MIATREQIHRLVDQLPDDQLAAAARYLEQLRSDEDSLLRVLREAPLDDEPWTDEDQAALDEALADIAAGRVVSHAEARRRLLEES